MRRRSLTCLLILACFFTSSRSASAMDWGFVRWLDRLSGPEDYWGPMIEFAPLCYGTRVETPKPETPGFHLDPGCFKMDREKLRIAIGGQWALLKGRNTLEYPPGQDIPSAHAVPLLATVDLGIDKRGLLEIGAGIGAVRFYGDRGEYSFWKFALEAPRITVKPLVLLADTPASRRKLEALQLRLSFVGIPGAFQASDFAAIGDWRTDSEYIGPAVAIIFNGWALLR